MKVVITCAGYASRLWPLTKDTPKPLLEVRDRPIVEHIVRKALELPGVDGIFVVTNAKFYDNFAAWASKTSFPVPLKVLNDGTFSNDDRLGQVGDIRFVLESESVDDDLLVVAGDNLFNFSLLPAFGSFRGSRSIINPLWESKSYRAARESGSVVLNDDLSFGEFMEKAAQPKSTLISLGIYFFPREKLHLFSRYISEGNNADKMGYFMSWLMEQERVFGHVYNEKWFDIGWIESLEQARQEFSG